MDNANYTRRDFLKLAGNASVVSSGWMAAEKIQTMECTGAEREAMLHGNARKLLRF